MLGLVLGKHTDEHKHRQEQKGNVRNKRIHGPRNGGGVGGVECFIWRWIYLFNSYLTANVQGYPFIES